METESQVLKAEFDPKVRTYWLLSGVLLCILTVVGIPLLLLWIPLGLMITGRFLARMECILTHKALKVKKGIMVRVEKTIPLEKITDMAMVQGPIMRYLGIHKLTVETAGQSSAGALVALTGIVDAQCFREAVLAQRDIVVGQSSKQKSPDESASDSAQSDHLEAIRDSLLRIESLLAKRSNDRES